MHITFDDVPTEEILDHVDHELKRQRREVHTMAKNAKKAPEEAAPAETPKVTAKQLAAELGTNDRELRKFLRDVIGKDHKPAGRWEWDPDDAQLDTIREAYADRKARKVKDEVDSIDDEFEEDDEVEELD